MSMAETLIAAPILLVASWTDIRFRRIPNCVSYTAIVVAFLSAAHSDLLTTEVVENNAGALANTLDAVTGLLGCFSILLITYSVGGLGGGDVKIGTFLGAATGLETGISILCISHLLAGAFALICIAGSRQPSASPKGIPMAVFYFLGTLFVALGVWL
ncbi:A24 family peptidase [Mariniblastus sp.]|nr:A24 family peptidase [Mariniblastus sp.]